MPPPAVDLKGLSLDRTQPSETAAAIPRRRWGKRYAIPVVILVGFAALLVAAAGDGLIPRPSVQVTPVIAKRSLSQPSGSPLFQAAGWIEPRPTSIRVAALAPGVIDQLLVVEGQEVQKDQPIAELIRIDAELAVQQARTNLALQQGELARTIAERDAARLRLRHPVHLQVQLAEAKNALAKSNTESGNLPFLIKAAQADVDFARRSLESKRAAGDAVSGRTLDQARSALATSEAAFNELKQRIPNVADQTAALQEMVAALEKQLSLLVNETQQLNEAEAKVKSATALRDDAKIKLQKAELMLDRTTVRAPISGRVLKLIAAPGTRVMGLSSVAGQNSSTVIEMYDPDRLQIRADVRLEDIPMVTRSQRVLVETASSTDPIQGRVLQTTSSANIQKNTLEVKVELLDPPTNVRPEMLVKATFLAIPSSDSSQDSPQRERLFVPEQLVQDAGGESTLWIVDASGNALIRNIKTGQRDGNELIEVTEGLTVTDKVISSPTNDLTHRMQVDVSK